MTLRSDPDPTAIILDALKSAAAAHGAHEAEDLGGAYDEAWPDWYAAHMVRSLAEHGYRIIHSE